MPWSRRYDPLFPPFPKPRPRAKTENVIGSVEERCRHRSERPFISSLGRWTLHLISNKGNFSILQPVYGDTATELGFYYFSFAASLYLLLEKTILLTLIGLCFPFPLWTFSPSVHREGDGSEELWVSTKRLVGVFVRVFWGDRLSFFVGAKSMGAQLSKTAGKAETAVEKAGEAAASPTKTNGQVNDIFKFQLLASITGENLVVLERGGGWCAQRGAIRAQLEKLNGDPLWEFKLKWQGVFFLFLNRFESLSNSWSFAISAFAVESGALYWADIEA